MFGLVINPWILGYLFVESGEIELLTSKVFVFSVEILLILCGGYLIVRRNTLVKKTFYFGLVAFLLMLLLLETSLHGVSYLIYGNGDKLSFMEQRAYLSTYQDKDWAPALFQDFDDYLEALEFEPFVMWKQNGFVGEEVTMNDIGLRSTWNPSTYEKVDPLKLFVFGGSTIWGTGARDDYTIPSQLSKLLNKEGIPFEVFNFGESGYTFTQELISLILALKDVGVPDYVIFYDGVNDTYAAYQEGSVKGIQNFGVMHGKLESNLTNLQHIGVGASGLVKEKLMIYRALDRLISLISPSLKFQEIAQNYSDGELSELSQAVVENYTGSASVLDKLAASYGFKYLVFWQPVSFLEDNLLDEERMVDLRLEDSVLDNFFNKVYMEISSNGDPAFHDISDVLRDRGEPVYIDFAHITEEGNRLVSERIFDIMRKKFFNK